MLFILSDGHSNLCSDAMDNLSWRFACLCAGFGLWWIGLNFAVYTPALTFGCWQIDPFSTALFTHCLDLHPGSEGEEPLLSATPTNK